MEAFTTYINPFNRGTRAVEETTYINPYNPGTRAMEEFTQEVPRSSYYYLHNGKKVPFSQNEYLNYLKFIELGLGQQFNQVPNQPSALDQINGGIREWISRQASTAPNVNVIEEVTTQQLAKGVQKQIFNDRIKQGTIDSYKELNTYRDKLEDRAYRPQARFNPVPQFYDTFESPYIGQKGTSGLRSNMPDKVNAYRDYSLDTNRGRILPPEYEAHIVGNEGVICGRTDFVENPNIMAYNPVTYGTNAEQPPDYHGMGEGRIFGPKPAAPIGGASSEVALAQTPSSRASYSRDFFPMIKGGNRKGPEQLYSTRDAYGRHFPSTLDSNQSAQLRKALKMGEHPHATSMRRNVTNESQGTYYDFY